MIIKIRVLLNLKFECDCMVRIETEQAVIIWSLIIFTYRVMFSLYKTNIKWKKMWNEIDMWLKNKCKNYYNM